MYVTFNDEAITANDTFIQKGVKYKIKCQSIPDFLSYEVFQSKMNKVMCSQKSFNDIY